VEGLKTEEEQVEAIKGWLRENGKSILIGIVVGLGAVFGWRGWVAYQQHRASEASAVFEQLLAADRAGEQARVKDLGERIIKDHGSTAYAFFGALTLAGSELDHGDLPAARSRLQWALGHVPDPSLEPVVRARLASVMLAQGEPQEALKLVDGSVPPAYAGQYEEIKGDAQLALGDAGQAKTAYEAALAVAAPEDKARIQMKLDNVPAGSKS
jgi:predicted negative regulator of RcsB-dependent stress response